MQDYEIIAEESGVARLRRPDGRQTVVRIDRRAGQVYDAMPGDRPAGGGRWFSRITDAGVDYVASWYSASYARQVFRQWIKDEAQGQDCGCSV